MNEVNASTATDYRTSRAFMLQPVATADAAVTGASSLSTRANAPPVAVRDEKLLLVDFENVPQFSLAQVRRDVRIVIYVGASQKSIPVELVTAAQPWGERLQWQHVNASGPNALDFFIACKLGQVLETARHTQCLVLSKDKGFDPLIRHLNSLGLKCVRVERMGPVPPEPESAKASLPKRQPRPPAPPAKPSPPATTKPPPSAQPPVKPANAYERILAGLRKSPAQARPMRRATLKNHVSAMTQKKLSDAEIDKLIAKLQSEKCVSFNGEKIVYTL